MKRMISLVLAALLGLAAIGIAGAANVVPNEIQQPGKLQFRAGVSAATLTYKDTGLTSRVSYSYVVTAWNDCNGNGVFDPGMDTESAASSIATATAQ